MGGPIIDARSPEAANRVKAEAFALGFELVGIAETGPATTGAEFSDWLAHDYHGAMSYLSRHETLRLDTRRPVEGVQSAIVVAMNYGGRAPSGPVARYARGDDYHDVMRARLQQLHERLEQLFGQPIVGRPFVDTGPVLERDLARKAGLGWFGKNTNLIHPQRGSFLFLGCLLVELELLPDTPFEADHCGRCTRCLDACPTAAFVAPRILDATKCISYLTIELREEIPEQLRSRIGELLYGCDICQDVCPWNVKFSQPSAEPAFDARPVLLQSARDLARYILTLDHATYVTVFRDSPMKRAKLAGLQRNACVVIGNVGEASDLETLSRAEAHESAMVQEHARWARHMILKRSQ